MKEFIEITFGNNALDILGEMFTSKYRGEKIKPFSDTFDIKLPEYFIKVKTIDDKITLEAYDREFKKYGITYIIDSKQNIVKYDNYGLAVNKEITNTSLSKVQIKNLDSIVVNAYVWTTYLFDLYSLQIPYTKRYNLDKKRRKTVTIDYQLTDDFLRDNIAFTELKGFDYSNIVNIPKIYTTFDICEKISKKYKGFEKAELLVPFKEFAIFFNDEKVYYCKYINGKIAIIEYEKGEKMIGALVDFEKNDNGENKYMLTPYDFYKYNDKSLDYKFIGGYGVSIVIMTLYFYTRFAVKKVSVKKEKSVKNEKGKINIKKENKETTAKKDEVIILPKVQRVYSYSITDTIKSGDIKPRKKPVYIKEQWQKQGFYRRTKTGKIVWVRPTTCTRHKEVSIYSKTYILDNSKIQ